MRRFARAALLLLGASPGTPPLFAVTASSNSPTPVPTQLNPCLENVTTITFGGSYVGTNDFLLGEWSYTGTYPAGRPYFTLVESLTLGTNLDTTWYMYFYPARDEWLISNDLGGLTWSWRAAQAVPWPSHITVRWQVDLGSNVLSAVDASEASTACTTTPAPTPSVTVFCESVKFGGDYSGLRSEYFGHYIYQGLWQGGDSDDSRKAYFQGEVSDTWLGLAWPWSATRQYYMYDATNAWVVGPSMPTAASVEAGAPDADWRTVTTSSWPTTTWSDWVLRDRNDDDEDGEAASTPTADTWTSAGGPSAADVYCHEEKFNGVVIAVFVLVGLFLCIVGRWLCLLKWSDADLKKRSAAIKRRAEEDAALEADLKVAMAEDAAEKRRQHQAATFEAALAAATGEAMGPLATSPPLPKPAVTQEQRRGKKSVTIANQIADAPGSLKPHLFP